MSRTTDEIRAVLDRLAQAIRDKDAAALTACYAPGPVVYSLAPPLMQPDDANGAGAQAWFDTWRGPIRLEQDDLEIVHDNDTAFAHGLAYMGGAKTDGGTPHLWLRQTYGLRRTAEGWRVVHEHQSVPFYMDGSLKAAVDLKP